MVNVVTHLHSYIKLMLNKQSRQSSEDSSTQSVMVLLMRWLICICSIFLQIPALFIKLILTQFFSLFAPQNMWPQIENGHLSRVPQYNINAFFLKRKTKAKIHEMRQYYYFVWYYFFIFWKENKEVGNTYPLPKSSPVILLIPDA